MIRDVSLNKTIRVSKELPRMASTIKMPPKQQTNDEVAESRAGQGRPVLHRYRIQVDRQTKSSFDDKAAAEKVAKAIKKAHPVVQVAIYDAESNERVLIAHSHRKEFDSPPKSLSKTVVLHGVHTGAHQFPAGRAARRAGAL